MGGYWFFVWGIKQILHHFVGPPPQIPSAKAVSPLSKGEYEIPPTPLVKGGLWSPSKQKILIISDFINKAWWIETYIHDVKNLLEARWHEVVLRWSNLPAWNKWQRKKRFWLLLSPFNFRNIGSLGNVLEKEKPNIVWFNSLLRWLWPNVIKTAWIRRKKSKSDCKFWMMYHDFWYFYPFPSELYHIEDCKTPLTKKNFLSAYKWNNLITKFAVLCKYYRLQPLKKALKKEVDLHLSPSDCVTNIARDSYIISEKKCKSFPHFIQK